MYLVGPAVYESETFHVTASHLICSALKKTKDLAGIKKQKKTIFRNCFINRPLYKEEAHIQSTQIPGEAGPSPSFPLWEKRTGKMISSHSEWFPLCGQFFKQCFNSFAGIFVFLQCGNQAFQSGLDFVCNFLIRALEKAEERKQRLTNKKITFHKTP